MPPKKRHSTQGKKRKVPPARTSTRRTIVKNEVCKENRYVVLHKKTKKVKKFNSKDEANDWVEDIIEISGNTDDYQVLSYENEEDIQFYLNNIDVTKPEIKMEEEDGNQKLSSSTMNTDHMKPKSVLKKNKPDKEANLKQLKNAPIVPTSNADIQSDLSTNKEVSIINSPEKSITLTSIVTPESKVLPVASAANKNASHLSDLERRVIKQINSNKYMMNIFRWNNHNEWSVITIDMIEKATGESYWTHKPALWQKIFANVALGILSETNEKYICGEFMENFNECYVRESPTNNSVKLKVTQFWKKGFQMYNV